MTTIQTRIRGFLVWLVMAGTAAAQHVASDWAPPGRPGPALKVGEVLSPRVRTPQFPLKDRRTLFSAAEIAQARENIARHPSARVLADEITQQAAYWLEWDDTALRDLVTTAEVPRAFDCSPAGCPVHGKKIFEVTKSTYPWKIDPRHPFKVTCPIGGESYPSNDYGKFYRSGFKDRSDFDGPYVDDGRGWVSPEGERFWFVAHANHWTWYWHPQANYHSIIKAMEYLGRAYLLTGDGRYAHKAAVLLRRIAEVYPNMDHETQSRFGEILAAKGERYSGKVVNAIWEAHMSTVLLETYDMIWDSIDGDTALQAFYGQDGPAIRAFIEANYVEEVIDAYAGYRTRGNYGMHQFSLLTAAIVRQHGDNARYLAEVVNQPKGVMFLGLRYALYNMTWRDGQPYESPEYNYGWVNTLTKMADLMQRLGQNIDTLPRLRLLLDAPLTTLAAGKFTPAIGDSGNVYGGAVGQAAPVYQQGFRAYGESRYAQYLAGSGAAGPEGFRSFESLLHPVVAASDHAPADGRLLDPQKSRLLSGYGLTLLNNPADTTAMSFYHGLHRAHVHFDRLTIELFANGQSMMPDLGYPDGMNEMVSGIFTWSLNTISHNTVTVDAGRQPGNEAGVLELQADGEWARAAIVNAPGTYPQSEVYRRSLVMVDIDATRSYAVDFFEVHGGRQHDYSLHGPPGDFALTGEGRWSEPARGTLAGEQVALGEIYDDPLLGAKDYKGGFAGYAGSGFQHLTQVRRLLGGEWTADYTHEKDPRAQLRLRVLPQPGQSILVAEARVSPVKWPQTIRYVIAHRESAQADLKSLFVGVLEPHTGEPAIAQVERREVPGGTAVIVALKNGRTDVILHGADHTLKQIEVAGHSLRSDARVAIFTLDEKNEVERLWFAGGTNAFVDGKKHEAAPSLRGTVSAIDAKDGTVRVKLAGAPNKDAVSALAGRVAHFSSAHASVNSIKTARLEGDELVLQLQDDVLVGLVRPAELQADRFVTASSMLFAKTYAGAGLRAPGGEFLGRVKAAGDNWIAPVDVETLSKLKTSEDVWLTQFSPGDLFEVQPVHAWRR